MKILYVSTSTETGGAERALSALAFAARQAGHEVRVISLQPIGPIGQQMQQQGLSVSSLDMQGKYNPFENAGVLARLVQEIQSFSPDIVHAVLYRAIQFCRLAKRRINFRLVTTPHYDLSKKNVFLRLLDRALKEADDISGAESQTTADFLTNKQRYNAQKLRKIVNGVDSAAFVPNESVRVEKRKELGFTDKEKVFICTARLSPEKNHYLLLQAFAAIAQRNPSVRLLLLGDGPEKETLEAWVAQNNLTKHVFFVGNVNNVLDFLLASDVFVLVSFIESLPLSLLEACLCGLPSIVSKVGDMPRVVQHGYNGFVCNSKDPVLLSVLMAELAQQKDLRQSMGNAARIQVKQFYPLPEPQYLRIYEEIVFSPVGQE